MPPVPARIEDHELHPMFCSCCQYICVAERSGLTAEDVEVIEEQIKVLINGFAPPQILFALQNQIANTLGFLEEHQPQGWEEDYYLLNDLLILVSEAASCT
tara:strand:+ start:9759 stop:10061 length:303 start_codon:yes stop_codon:yes gene_type:complete